MSRHPCMPTDAQQDAAAEAFYGDDDAFELKRRHLIREAFRAGFTANIDPKTSKLRAALFQPYDWTFDASFNADLEPQAWRAWERTTGAVYAVDPVGGLGTEGPRAHESSVFADVESICAAHGWRPSEPLAGWLATRLGKIDG
jgi:hypothetical protein